MNHLKRETCWLCHGIFLKVSLMPLGSGRMICVSATRCAAITVLRTTQETPNYGYVPDWHAEDCDCHACQYFRDNPNPENTL